MLGKVWDTPIKGGHMYNVYQKLKLLRGELMKLNKESFGKIIEMTLCCRNICLIYITSC